MGRPGGEVTSARRVAYQVLGEVGQGRRLDRALDAARPSDADRAWIQELTYGVQRLRGRLDHILDGHLERGLESLPEPVRIHLEMGLYQLLYMDSVPTYAAVSQTVAGVRAVVGPGLAPLANAVLRRASESGEDRDSFPNVDKDPASFLATWGSHPLWLVKRWIDRWDVEVATQLIEANNRIPEVTVRTVRGSRAEALEILGARGIEAVAVAGVPSCLAIRPARFVAEAIQAIEGYAQDPAAATVAAFCGFESGSVVVDLCAAPGGKALALASQGIDVVAVDLSQARSRMVRHAAVRLGASVRACVGNAEHPPVGEVDGVLLDAPCTGTGTLRRHPDARWKLTEASLHSLQQIQSRLLEGAATSVRVGGTLVYATCSLEYEENEGQVERFLARHPEFRLEQPPQAAFEVSSPAGDKSREGILSLLPTDTGYDGAFAARMKRIR